MKAFALLVVKEQQCVSELLEEQRCQVKELTAITDNIKQVGVAHPSGEEDQGLKSQNSKVERHSQVSIFQHSYNTMTAKAADTGSQSEQLLFRRRQLDDLEGTGTVLRKADKELREVNERETGPPSLLSEVEVLRRRVVEMEGKDEELIRMRDQCRELDCRIARESKHCCSLKVEVDKLNVRISELDRLEEALGKSKQDCSVLKGSLEKERDVSKILSGEVDALKNRVRELEAIEGQLEKSEAAIRHDLAKLRSLTVVLVEDRKTMSERLRQAEEKLSRRESKYNDKSNMTTMIESLKEERQQAQGSKSDLEERIMGIAREKDELQARLITQEQRNGELQSKITIMKKKLQVLEIRKENEKYMNSSLPNTTNHHFQTEEINVKALTQELERLQKRLQDKEVLEKELLKVEEDYESLEKRFNEEQAKSKALRKELEVAKKELYGYQQAEKQEVNQEHLLLCHLQKEQVKSRLLTRELDTLKEKLQTLMEADESICRVQTDHSVLQGKLTQQEARNRELAKEMSDLSSELDSYGWIKHLTPGGNREHVSNFYQTDKDVQTETTVSPPPDYSCQVHSLNEKLDEEDEDDDPNHNVEVMNRRGSTLVNNLNNSLNSVNSIESQNRSYSVNGMNTPQRVNGEVMTLTHTPGQPLHIKVTPHHILNTATLEISGTTADTATSYTSTAVIPKSGTPPSQRITIIQNSALASVNGRTPVSSPDRTISPLNGTPVARMLSLNSSRSATTDRNDSPIQILTVRTCTPEPTEVTNHASFCSTPKRQNSWQHLRSNNTDTSPGIITTEDNKIHIHLGSPYIQPHSVPQSVGPYYVRHEQRTQVLSNGCHVKGVGKITSSITISPATSPASHSSI